MADYKNINIQDIPDGGDNPKDFYETFKERLEDLETFPKDYTYKFILPKDQAGGNAGNSGSEAVLCGNVHPNIRRLHTEEPVALPQLTPEQRAEALKKAAEARKARAELKDKLKRGGTDLKQVLADADSDPIIGKMKVSALLEALPKVGKVKAQEIMTELEIAPTRRLRGLGDRQRRALLERFGYEA
jgi:hypothetical protein